MQPSDRQKIEELERGILKQLKSPRRDLRQIAQDLKKLKRLKPTGTLAVEQDRLEELYRQHLATYGSKLAAQVQSALKKLGDALVKGELPTEDWAGQARGAIEELRALGYADENLPRWKKELDAFERERDDLAKVLAITREVEALWARANQTEQERGNPNAIIDDMKDALAKVQGYIKSHHITTPGPKRKLETLAANAQTRLTYAREHHDKPLSRWAGEEIVTQLKVFRQMKPDELVTYPESAEPDATNIVQEASKAAKVAEDKVQRFWYGKVVDYTDGARRILDQHDPFGAQRELEKCGELPGLNDAEVGLSLTGDPQTLINNLRELVTKAVTARQTAESFCQQALAQSDLGEAYTLLRRAIETDRFTPEISVTQTTLRERAITQCKSCVEDAEAQVEEGDWERAEGSAKTAARLLALDPEIQAGDLPDRILGVQKTLEDIKKLKTEVGAETDPKKARAIFDRFSKRYASEQIEKWEDVRQLGDDLLTQANAQDLLVRLKAKVAPGATLEQLETASTDYQSWQDKIPVEYRAQFEAVKRDLDARLGYLNALGLRDAQDLAGALAALQPALEHPELGTRAANLQKELNAKKASEAEARQAIDNIRKNIQHNPQQAYRDAVTWKNNATLHTSDFVDLEHQALANWESRTKEIIDHLLARQSFDAGTIRKIRECLAEFNEMHSDLEAEYHARADLPCAVAEAESLEKSTPPRGNTEWSAVVQAWEKACTLAREYAPADGPKYWARRLTALKKQTYAEARGASPSGQIDLFSNLNDEFDERDAEVWLWLGEAHLRAGEAIMITEEDALTYVMTAAGAKP